jgi:Flp pilus assembly protein TadG
MVEFALVAPILVLVIFGILDFGRSIYYYNSVSQAVGEAARAATLAPSGLPSNSDVLAAAQRSADWVTLPSCPNGAVTTAGLPAGKGWLFIDQPASPNNNASDSANAPGGEGGSASCSATPAESGDKLQVEIVYNFTPFTPLISQITGSQIFLSSTSIVPVEY